MSSNTTATKKRSIHELNVACSPAKRQRTKIAHGDNSKTNEELILAPCKFADTDDQKLMEYEAIIAALKHENKLQQLALVGDIQTKNYINNTQMDFVEKKFEALCIGNAKSAVIDNIYAFKSKTVAEDDCYTKSEEFPHAAKNVTRIDKSVQKEMRLSLEIVWEEPVCTLEHHQDEDGNHIGKFDANCSIEWQEFGGTGILASTIPYFAIITGAHNLEGCPGCTNEIKNRGYFINWCPWGDKVYQIPLHWGKIHEEYNLFEMDPAADIAIMIGERNDLPDEILSLDRIPIYQMNLASFSLDDKIDYDYHFEGYSSLIRADGKTFFYTSPAVLLDNSHKKYSWAKSLAADISTYKTKCLEYTGCGLKGFSGGALWAEHRRNGKKTVIGIQSIGKAVDDEKNPNRSSMDTECGIACKITPEKMQFLVDNMPCCVIRYDRNDCKYISIYDDECF